MLLAVLIGLSIVPDEETAPVATSATSTISHRRRLDVEHAFDDGTDDRDAGANHRIAGGPEAATSSTTPTTMPASTTTTTATSTTVPPTTSTTVPPTTSTTVPPTTLPPTTVPPTIAITDRAGVAVLVINGGAAVGAARAATEQLRQAGFQPRAAVDAVQGVERRALVLYAPGQEAAANSVNETIGAAPDAVVPAPPGDPNWTRFGGDLDILVVLGPQTGP